MQCSTTYMFCFHILFHLSQHVAVVFLKSGILVLHHSPTVNATEEKNRLSEQWMLKLHVLHFLFRLKLEWKGRVKEAAYWLKDLKSQRIRSTAVGPRRVRAPGFTGSEPKLLHPDQIRIPLDQSFLHSNLWRQDGDSETLVWWRWNLTRFGFIRLRFINQH